MKREARSKEEWSLSTRYGLGRDRNMTVRKEAKSYALNVSREAGPLWISLLSFLIWALATCLLEGRAHVLLEMDPLERAFDPDRQVPDWNHGHRPSFPISDDVPIHPARTDRVSPARPCAERCIPDLLVGNDTLDEPGLFLDSRFHGNDNQNHANPQRARPPARSGRESFPPPTQAFADRPCGNDRLLCAGLVGHGSFPRKQESTPRPERKSIS